MPPPFSSPLEKVRGSAEIRRLRTEGGAATKRSQTFHLVICCCKTLERVIIKTILMTELTLTAVYEEAEEGGYIGYVAELPGANTQGETLEEVRENLIEAIQLILEVNRTEFERNLSSTAKVIREQLILRAA